MKTISVKNKAFYNDSIWTETEKQFGISIRKDIKLFFEANNGGYPINSTIMFDGDEYEVRAFLSLDKNDEHYCIDKPLIYFLDKTKARIVPIALDSGDNYYCVNNETGKVYYWRASCDTYYLVSNSLEQFADLF